MVSRPSMIDRTHSAKSPALNRSARLMVAAVLLLAGVLSNGCAPREDLSRPLVRIDVSRDGKPATGAKVIACTNLDTPLESGCKQLDESVTDEDGHVTFGSLHEESWGLWCPVDFNESYTVVLACDQGLVDAAVIFGRDNQELSLELDGLGMLDTEELGTRRMTQYEKSGVQRLAAEFCDFDESEPESSGQ